MRYNKGGAGSETGAVGFCVDRTTALDQPLDKSPDTLDAFPQLGH